MHFDFVMVSVLTCASEVYSVVVIMPVLHVEVLGSSPSKTIYFIMHM